MTKIQTSKLRPGMIVGNDVLNYDNKTIIAKGTKLSQTLITRLELYGILSIYVDETAEQPVPENTGMPADSIPDDDYEPSHFEKIRETEMFREFQADYEEGRKSLEFTVSEMVDKNVEVDPILLLEKPLDMIVQRHKNYYKSNRRRIAR